MYVLGVYYLDNVDIVLYYTCYAIHYMLMSGVAGRLPGRVYGRAAWDRN